MECLTSGLDMGMLDFRRPDQALLFPTLTSNSTLNLSPPTSCQFSFTDLAQADEERVETTSRQAHTTTAGQWTAIVFRQMFLQATWVALAALMPGLDVLQPLGDFSHQMQITQCESAIDVV